MASLRNFKKINKFNWKFFSNLLYSISDIKEPVYHPWSHSDQILPTVRLDDTALEVAKVYTIYHTLHCAMSMVQIPWRVQHFGHGLLFVGTTL